MKNISLDTLMIKMTESLDMNIKYIKDVFKTINYRDDENQSLLHIFVDELFDEKACFLAIKSLLKAGLNPNLSDKYGYNFIQTALYTGYSENFIIDIIKEALNYELNVNHVDDDKDTIMHTAIYSDDYKGEIINIYHLLCYNGFDSNILDIKRRNLVEAIKYQNNDFKANYGEYMYTEKQIEDFSKLFYLFKLSNLYEQDDEERTNAKVSVKKYSDLKSNSNNTKFPNKVNNGFESNNSERIVNDLSLLSSKEITFLEKHGKILNKKIYRAAPTIGREKELENLIISLASSKKQSILVGKSGVGKTVIVEELAYRIINNQVPTFLQGKIILEINPSSLVANTRYVGEFEEKMTKLMDFCEKNGIIVFIDEIHTIYGLGSTTGKDNDVASILKYYIDRTDMKVIGTTTVENYNKYFVGNDLVRRFEKIEINEPSNEVLFQILNKVIDDYCIEKELSFDNFDLKEEIIKIIINATDSKHRRYDDTLFNPDLSISIIDRAFAYAKVFDSSFITIDHFIKSIEFNDRIYLPAKEMAIFNLTKLNDNLEKINGNVKSKVLRVDFTRKKKI